MKKFIYTLIFLSFITPNYGQNSLDSISLSTKGIYNTFYDFMIGSPDEVDNFYVDSALLSNGVWTDFYFKTPRYLNTKKSIKSIWGFSDGNKTYINIYNYFFEIFKDGEQLYYYGFGLHEISASRANKKVNSVVSGNALTTLSEYADSQTRKHKYLIEMMTAKIFPSKFIMEMYMSECHLSELIIYRISKGESIEPMLFLIDGVEYNFSPNSYLKLEIPFRWKPVNITYTDESQNNNTFSVHLNEESPVYVRCENKAKKEKIEFVQVEIEKGSFESYKPRKKQKKRNTN